ncbi:NDT-like domain-containing protein raw isoform X3 [Choristoneura fumiferana]|uniref:NDT-like domain-containing protein raw isoform X3 n=1 Tax=Choristoneura fumiferana TaxID=7141 RepID=UPI003D15D6CB
MFNKTLFLFMFYIFVIVRSELVFTCKCNHTTACEHLHHQEVANAWERQVGKPDQPAPLNRVKSLFYDIQLYPTEVQVFEMLVCASKCARRKTLILTFGEACVFAAELRRLSRQVRQSPNKLESPIWNNVEKDFRNKETLCRPSNGSEASSPTCEVFLGGSCNPTTWRTEIAIPKLKKMGISYFNPQVDDWSTELMEAEFQAKNVARALLFVLDSETRAVAASVEAALLAATPKLLLLVMRPYSRQQAIGQETITDQEYIELSRARATLKEAVERRGLPAFHDISSALDCAGEVLRGRNLTHPRHMLGHTILRLKRYYDAAGGRDARLSRLKAIQALQEATRVPREVAERYLPPTTDAVDFEAFCVAVAELAAGAGSKQSPRAEGMAARLRRAFRSFCDRFTPLTAGADGSEGQSRNGREEAGNEAERGAESGPTSGLRVYNARLRSYGRKLPLFIPKNGGNRSEAEGGASGETVLTPSTERRLEGLPGMLATPKHDVYLGGSFPSNGTRPDEFLRREGFTCIMPRPNDYARMYSAPARRSAPAHPESPRRDKKPRPMSPPDEDVQLRRPPATSPAPATSPVPAPGDPGDRLSASDFYSVTEDVTPQPFKGTYDEDQLLSSSVLVFSISSEAPCFATMVLAAHHIGLQPSKTVLVVQPMDPANSYPYSEVAVKDYNRGRHYLSDLARRAGIPVFDNVDEAMACVVSRLRTAT